MSSLCSRLYINTSESVEKLTICRFADEILCKHFKFLKVNTPLTYTDRPVAKGRGRTGGTCTPPPAEQKLFFAYFPVKLGSCPPLGGAQRGHNTKKTPFVGKKFFVLPPSSRAGYGPVKGMFMLNHTGTLFDVV